MATLASGPSQLSRRLLTSTARTRTPTRRVYAPRLLSSTSAQRTSPSDGKRPRPGDQKDGGSQTKWYPIPVGLGIGVVGLVQFYKVSSREREKQRELNETAEDGARPKRRPRVRPEGPWQVRVMSTLPLKAMSRLWGKFNELTIPYYLRVPGFRLYSFIFGVK